MTFVGYCCILGELIALLDGVKWYWMVYPNHKRQRKRKRLGVFGGLGHSQHVRKRLA